QALTAAGAGVLVQQGRLDLDAPVQRYLPDFPRRGVATGAGLGLPPALFRLLPESAERHAASTRQAMAHTAGFRGFQVESDYLPKRHCNTLAEGLSRFRDEPLLFEPGTRQRYSPYGWVLVSAVLEAVAGMPFADYMQQAVFAPLGMRSTRLDEGRPGTGAGERAAIYWPRANEDTSYGLEHPDPVDLSCFAGAYQLLSTPSDLVRFG